MKKVPKGLNKEEQFQLGIFRLMRDTAELENQLITGKDIKRFIQVNPNKAKKIRRSLANAHCYIQEAAKQFSNKKPKEKQISFSLDIENL